VKLFALMSAAATLAALGLVPAAGAGPAGERSFRPQPAPKQFAATHTSVIVTLDGPATAERAKKLARSVGGFAVKRRFNIIDAFEATMSRAQAKALSRLGGVVRVEPNGLMHALNDSAQASFGAAKARVDAGVDGDGDGDASTYSAADLVAAVIDSGIDTGHLDLDDGKVIAFANCLLSPCTTPAPFDDLGHGTHVAATLAGDGEARIDRKFRGVAPGAALVGVKVLSAAGAGTSASVIAGIQWAANHKALYGIEAINLSLGQAGCSSGTDAVSAAINAAVSSGLVAVVAAGNEGPGTCTIGSPGAAADALTVGAMADLGPNDPAGGFGPGFYQGWFSSRGPTADGRIKPDVSAPGVDITSAQQGTATGYMNESGTSMAAPFVAGVALLMLDVNPLLTPQEVKQTINATAVDWGRGGRGLVAGSSGADIEYGAGRLDAYAALQSAGAAISAEPLMPTHELAEGALAGTGATVDYPLQITSTGFPIAATLTIPGVAGPISTTTDFDLYLLDPDGVEVSSSEFITRQEELGYLPPTTGTYILRVQSYAGSGEYYVDVSAPMGPPPPSLSVADTSMTEGTAGTRPATFTVSLSQAAAAPISVLYATEDGSATAPADYSVAAGSVTFTPGQVTKTVTVQISGDTLVEQNEFFFVKLSSASGATIADSHGRGTILNDDAMAALSVGDVRIVEGSAAATFRVTLSHASDVPVVANFLTENGTASAPGDYGASAGTVSFAPGEVAKTITIPVVADRVDEVDEMFALTVVGPVNATIADGEGTATIADDDPPPGIAIGNARTREPDCCSRRARFIVRLSAPSALTIRVRFATANGTARAPGDYRGLSGTLTFLPGRTSAIVSVRVRGDRRRERNETFFVKLSAPVSATIVDGRGRGLIVNND
jgi:serine protease AprX